ncbi:hypothetical protein, partial [Shewanella sp. SACH]|uniref:hypothetical protein n=1 Tax=Shewanella sp. SACH TaxID=1873135 RepID=UPI0014836C29
VTAGINHQAVGGGVDHAIDGDGQGAVIAQIDSSFENQGVVVGDEVAAGGAGVIGNAGDRHGVAVAILVN